MRPIKNSWMQMAINSKFIGQRRVGSGYSPATLANPALSRALMHPTNPALVFPGMKPMLMPIGGVDSYRQRHNGNMQRVALNHRSIRGAIPILLVLPM